ncbi:MAG TPA: UvrD-helicase domain-containing protein [Candidatus Caccenecus avistercoris]|nr:UvrD-helicase domain-containing protein [Candidatus Caccenecus avistercoris]
MEELKAEKEHLRETIAIIKEILLKEQMSLEKIYSEHLGSREELWRIANRKKIHIHNLESSLDTPYFARIDFTFEKDGKLQTIYIGKNGIMQNTNIIVTDWRAPISSLYYDSEVGHCSFTSPEGEVSGNLELKRQYEINSGNLISYYDVDLVSTDALLQKYLNSNNDSRLKSIVSTIQKEQNEVIRRNLFDNLIIQGVAGSGKTTVALHRIAYLVYNYRDSIKQNQYLVIGPNPIFIKYISSVLPELDVSSVKQGTFEGFAQNYIDEEININSPDKKVTQSIAGKIDNDIDKFKSSMNYKTMLDQFLQVYFYSITAKDFTLDDFTVLNSQKVKEVFDSTYTSTHISLASRIELTIEKLSRIIEDNIDSITTAFTDYTFQAFANLQDPKEEEKMRKKIVKNREELHKFCKSSLRKYFAKAKIDATKLYKLFISSIENYDIFNYKYLKTLKKDTMKNIKNGCYDFEDLASLIYLQKVIAPNPEYSRIRHVVVDEAQDLGEFNFFVLKSALPSSTFSIFGDLAQSIYDYRGIDNWNIVNKIMFDNNGRIINFKKSYRTTSEIMEVADEVSESIGMIRSDLVVRHGKEVDFTPLEQQNIPSYIAGKIKEYKEKGYKTIAIISKTNLLSCYINDGLAELGVNIPNITLNDDLSEDNNKVCTISNQLAKGLEFDAVIINNANENIYSSSSNLDMKLLYVAITRALHELDIVYSGELPSPLRLYLKKKDNVLKLKRSKG